jgi:choline-sulfatase
VRTRQLAPILAALAAWGAGTVAALRHGTVPRLLSTLFELAIPYLVLGLFAMWAARGLARGAGDRPGSRLVRWEPWIGAGIAASGAVLAVVYTILERPAAMAASFWRLQAGLDRGLSPAIVAGCAALGATLLIAGALAGWWRSSSRGGRRVALITVSSVMLVIVILIFAPRLRRGFRTSADPARPNVLLIVVDSLRPDRAANPELAPHMAALAARSVRFHDARTPCALTYPAVASLLTGEHPLRHGVRGLHPEAAVRDLGKNTLPRALALAGYRTIAVGGYCATPLRELDAGFATQCTPRGETDSIASSVAFRGHPWLPAVLPFPWARAVFPQLRAAIEGSHPGDITSEAVAAWRRGRGPFFMTVLYDNPHLPYVPVWPDSRRTTGYAGPNRYTMLAQDLVEPGDEVERANARVLYDAAVRSTDRAIGRLLAKLDRDGLAENTIVVLVADHGENLLDDGGALGHGEAIDHDRSNAIPWTVAWPDRLAPRDVDVPVLLTDVTPTLLSLLALPRLPDADGTDRAPVARGLGGDAEMPALLETGKNRRLELGAYALTYRPSTAGATFALYRRDLDPGLTRDLAASEPEKCREMVALFQTEAERLGDPP